MVSLTIKRPSFFDWNQIIPIKIQKVEYRRWF